MRPVASDDEAEKLGTAQTLLSTSVVGVGFLQATSVVPEMRGLGVLGGTLEN